MEQNWQRTTANRRLTRTGSLSLITEYFPTTENRQQGQQRTVKENEAKCVCGKTFKNKLGLKIHKGKTSCGKSGNQKQRTELVSGETEEEQNLETHHSDLGLQAGENRQDNHNSSQGEEQTEEQINQSLPHQQEDQRRKRIKWPAMSANTTWEDLDEELDKILEAALMGPAETKVESMVPNNNIPLLS
jgi:hypothetical protein